MPRTRQRRVRGEGSIYCRASDGIWVGAYVQKIGGIRKRRVVYGQTADEVSTKLQELRSMGATPRSRTKLTDFFESWIAEIERTKRDSTAQRYASIARTHVMPVIGEARLHDVDAATIRHLDDELAKLKRSSATRHAAYLITSAALSYAVKMGLLLRNPCELASAPRHQSKEIGALSLDDARKLVKAAAAERLGAMYVLAIATGLRQAELFGLKRADIDLQHATLAVRRSLKESSAGVVEVPPKTKAGTRVVTIPEFALASLRAHLEASMSTTYVFVAAKGGPLRKSVFMRKEWQPFLTRANLPTITFHTLRHTAATLRMMAGVHPRVAQEALGHSSVNVTLGTYSHVAPNMQKEAADLVSNLFEGSPS